MERKVFFNHGVGEVENYNMERFTLCVNIVNEKQVSIGISVCNSADTFNRKTGRELAQQRAESLKWTYEMGTTQYKKIIRFLHHLTDTIGNSLSFYKEYYL